MLYETDGSVSMVTTNPRQMVNAPYLYPQWVVNVHVLFVHTCVLPLNKDDQ